MVGLKKGDVDVANLCKADDTVRKALARLGNVLTTEQLTQLNSQVDNDKKDPQDVANAYAKQHGLAQQTRSRVGPPG